MLVVAGSLVRLAYAAGVLGAPRAMARRELGPGVDDPFVAMTTRAFGAVHTNVAVMTLAAVAPGRDVDRTVRLDLGCDAGDLAATILAWRRDGLPPSMAAIGIVAPSASVAVWSAAPRSHRARTR